jgi:hypothetical protein
MSLIDLKKGNQNKVKKKDFTVDEFISDATNYAEGKPKVVSHQADTLQKVQLKKQNQALNKRHKATGEQIGQTVPFRRSTFTLSEGVIQQLNLLSQETHLAKSHIIRILIEAVSDSSQSEALKKILNEYKD